MKKIVSADTISDVISLEQLSKQKQGIIAIVYDRQVSILTPYNHSANGSCKAFFMDKYYSQGCKSLCFAGHTASDTAEICISRSLKEKSEGLFFFDDWADFAKAVMENGWC